MTSLTRRALMILFAIICSLATIHGINAEPIFQGETASTSPIDVLRSARTIFIRTKSVYFKPAALEQALLNRDEIQQWGVAITRNEADADLIIEVDRKLFTNRFVYSVLDPHRNRVVAAGKIGSLGGSVEDQIADSFVKRMRKFRPLNTPAPEK